MQENVELSDLSSRKILAMEDIPTKLLSLLEGKNVVEFGRILENHSLYANHFYDDPYKGSLLHIACCSKGNHEIVKILLDHGAEINLINEACKSAPIHEAIKIDDIETLKVLLSNANCNLNLRDRSERRLTPAMKAAYLFRADMLRELLEASPTASYQSSILRNSSAHKSESADPIDYGTVLLSLFHGIMDGKYILNEEADDEEDDEVKKCDFRKCLDYVLDKTSRSQSNVNSRDPDGNTALHYAVKLNDQQTVLRLLNAGSYVCNKNKAGEVLLKLIKPATLKQYLDSCVSTNAQSSIRPKYQIIFNCEIFRPPANHPCIPEIEPLLELNKVPELRQFLEHPVLDSLLTIKWYLAKKWYYLNVMFYVAFCLALCSYVFYVSCSGQGHNQGPSMSNDNRSANQSTTTPIPVTSTTTPATSATSNVIKYVLRSLTWILCMILALREFLQMSVSIRNYLHSLENWLEMILIITTIRLLVWRVDLELGAVAILASGFELVLLIGRYPKLSTNIEIFKTVTINFLKFLSCYSILIFAFAISSKISKRSGNVTTKDDDVTTEDDQSPLHQLANILINSMSTIVQPKGDHVESQLNLKHLIFMLNVFFITIVLFSLLNGLAVNDIHVIKKNARLLGIVSRMRCIWYVDSVSAIDLKRIICFAKKVAKFCCCCCCRKWCCPNFTEQQQNLEKYTKILHIQSRLFPDTLPDCKIHILPNQNMAVSLVNKLTTSSHEPSAWRMDEDIMKRAGMILEKCKPFDYELFFKKHVKPQLSDIKNELKHVCGAVEELQKLQSQSSTISAENISEPPADRSSLEIISSTDSNPQLNPEFEISIEPNFKGEKTDSDSASQSNPPVLVWEKNKDYVKQDKKTSEKLESLDCERFSKEHDKLKLSDNKNKEYVWPTIDDVLKSQTISPESNSEQTTDIPLEEIPGSDNDSQSSDELISDSDDDQQSSPKLISSSDNDSQSAIKITSDSDIHQTLDFSKCTNWKPENLCEKILPRDIQLRQMRLTRDIQLRQMKSQFGIDKSFKISQPEESIPSKLLSLLKEHNLAEFSQILKDDSSHVNHYYGEHYGTLLHIACCSKGKHEFIKILLDHGADINFMNKTRGSAPIHGAVEHGDIETLDVLLSNKNCDLNLRDHLNRTPAMIAAFHNRANILSKLLEKMRFAGLPIVHNELIDSFLSSTRLGYGRVKEFRRLRCLYHIREAKKNPVKEAESYSGLREEATKHHKEQPQNKPASSETAVIEEDIPLKLLSSLEQHNHIRFGQILAKHSSYVDYFHLEPHFGTLLHIACRSKGNHKIVRSLVSHGADINLINEARGSAPIHEAIENADMHTLDALLSSKKCDLTLRDKHNRTPAMKAAFLIQEEMLNFILKRMNIAGLPIDQDGLFNIVLIGWKDEQFVNFWSLITGKANQLSEEDAESCSESRKGATKRYKEPPQSFPISASQTTTKYPTSFADFQEVQK